MPIAISKNYCIILKQHVSKRICQMVPQPSGKAIDCNSVIIGSNPIGTSIFVGIVAKQADATDLKSVGSNPVWVQVPPSPPYVRKARKSFFSFSQKAAMSCFFCFYRCNSDSCKDVSKIRCVIIITCLTLMFISNITLWH